MPSTFPLPDAAADIPVIPASDSTKTDGKRSKGFIITWSILWAFAGIAEGFFACKSLVPYPKVLADQFVFKNCVVLKMFMSAVGCSMVSQAVMSHFAPEQFAKSRYYGQTKFGFARVACGTTILGVGMAIAGNGPTMVSPALGGFVKTAWALLLGACVAPVFVGAVDMAMKRSESKSTWSPQPGEDPLTAEGVIEYLTGKTVSYKLVAFGIGCFMIVMAIVLEFAYPFKENVAIYGGPLASMYPSSIFEYPAWPPTLAGACIGLGQVPVRMLTSDGMGGATSFFNLAATFSGGKVFGQLALFKSVANWGQLVYNYVWVLLGALLARVSNAEWALDSTMTQHNTQSLTDGFDAWRMFIGAFLAIVGARFAGGCTCGHGVSGTSELSIESFVGAAGIFGGAILCRVIIVYGLNVEY